MQLRMSKKKHHKLNKLLKQQQFQQLAAGVPVTPALPKPSVTSDAHSLPAAPAAIALPADRHLQHEILRTLISLVVIVTLLVVAVGVDRRTTDFARFGSWLFQTLRLNNK